MACFLVPTAEAIVTTIVTRSVQAKQAKQLAQTADSAPGISEWEEKLFFSRRLNWLTNMLWGGSALLAFEHVWHGEVVPWFPFLTAAGKPDDARQMLHEMATVGVTMAVCVTAVWVCMVIASCAIEKRASRTPSALPPKP
ncbi:MAG: hypothetical protein VB071_00375 [Lawsonibacter sp.]|nr:hypothetical protein [Lawsonibacter sp.]